MGVGLGKVEAKEKEKIQFKYSSFMKPGLVSPSCDHITHLQLCP